MSIFNTLKKWFGPVHRQRQYSDDVYAAFGVDPDGSVVTPESSMRVSAVYACVEKLCGGISTLPINVYQTDGKDRKLLKRNALWYMLNEEPCKDFTASSAWDNVVINNCLRGDGFILIRRRMDGSIRDLLPLPWSSVFPTRMPDTSIRYYIFDSDYNIRTWVSRDDILHFPGLGFDGIKSMSVIKYAARNATSTALAMDKYSSNFFQNGAHPSVILTYPKPMTTENIEGLQKSFQNKYSGLSNSHKLPLILTDGGDAKTISLSAEDAQLLDSRKFQVIDIARAFGVPPHMIGETSANTSWGSGIESLTRGFFTYTLQQRLVKIEQELNRKIFPRDERYRIEFDRDALLEGDSSAQSTYYRAALGGPGTGLGWMTVDEIRKRKNLSPLGGVAAEIYDPRSTETGNPNGQNAETVS